MTTLSPAEAAAELRGALADAARGLVEREGLLELVALAAVAREHVLVLGPPGTAKSEAVRRVARATSGRYFEYLLGRFTEPSEIFGPIDLRKLREGVVETETAGMLPEAEVAFLDEVFLGSTAILNTLLGVLNERRFRRGRTEIACPLRVCVGASNQLPDDDALAAFADRFLVRVFVAPVADPRLEELLEGGWADEREAERRRVRIEHLDVLSSAAFQMDLSAVRPRLADAVRALRGAGITLSDRRVVKCQRLVAAAAALAGRDRPGEGDLWPLVGALPTREEQALARDVLQVELARSENAALSAAAAEASRGPLARAGLLEAKGRELLASRPRDEDADEKKRWLLRLEGVARSIDASLAPEARPSSLSELRAALVAELGAP